MATKPIEKLIRETTLEQVSKTKFLQCSPETPVGKAIEQMQALKSGYIAVTQDKKLIGLFTENDVVKKILEQDLDWNRPVREFVEPNPIVLTPKDSVAVAIARMGEHRIYHIPLVNEKQELVEVLSVRALIRLLAEFYPAEVLNLPPKPNQLMETVEGG